MKAKYDEGSVTITPDFRAALIAVMRAECKMMIKHDRDSSEMWYWGRCTIHDLSAANGIDFEYGKESDIPKDGLGRFAVKAG